MGRTHGKVTAPVDGGMDYIRGVLPPIMLAATDPSNPYDWFIAENVANPSIYEYFRVDGVDMRDQIVGAANNGSIAGTDIKMVQGRSGRFEDAGGYMSIFSPSWTRYVVEFKYADAYSNYQPGLQPVGEDERVTFNSDGSVRLDMYFLKTWEMS